MAGSEWDIYLVDEVRDWIETLDEGPFTRVVQALDALAEAGPGPGRPLVDSIHGSSLANMKELRPDPSAFFSSSIPGEAASFWSVATRRASGNPGTRWQYRWLNSDTRRI
jgi:hypothetical protein